jgi:hypothetical protein|tara:strand:+ start:1631 stop:1780 length:150 start_codon:yes stop_codon:yes gene_type:complete
MKNYKGKEVHFKKFKDEEVLNGTKIICEYEGYCSADEYDEEIEALSLLI